MKEYKKQIAVIVISAIVILACIFVYVKSTKSSSVAEEAQIEEVTQVGTDEEADISQVKSSQSPIESDITLPSSEAGLSQPKAKMPASKVPADSTVVKGTDYKDFKDDPIFQPASWEPYEYITTFLNAPVDDLKDTGIKEALYYIYVPNSEMEGLENFLSKYMSAKLKEIDAKYPYEENLTRCYNYDTLQKENCSEEIPYKQGYTLIALEFKMF